MIKHLHLKGFVALAAAFAMSTSAFAATQINDAAGLAAMAYDLAGEYELTADIQLSGEWAPIGNNDAPFTGTFNGNGHSISGLTYTTNGNWVGLFGASTGTIKNVRIVGANIYGNEHVGIAVGRVFGGGVVDNVFTSGYVCGRDHAGGIAGDAGETDQTATVTNCLSMADVIGREYQAGGIVGWSKGTVTISNNVFLGEAYVGGYGGCAGIVAFVEDGTTTVTCNVNAARRLTGIHEGRNTYGIVGNVYNENSILQSSDNLTSDATVIINRNDGSVVDQSAMSVDYNGSITPVAELKTAATYQDLGFGAEWNLSTGNYPVLAGMTLPVDGDFIHTDAIPEEVYTGNTINLNAISTLGREITYATNNPSVATVANGVVSFLKAGEATITLATTGDSFSKGYTLTLKFAPKDMDTNIASAADFVKFTENPLGNFKLVADIDMSGVDFTPIARFEGSLDGQNHYIRNLSYNDKDRDNVALFAEFGGTFIKNLGFENLNLVGNANVAAVAGKTTSASVISNIVVANSYIEGRDHVASLLGNLDGNATVSNCLSNAQIVTRSYQAAGIAGVQNHGTIEKCIFAGTVASIGGATNVTGITSLLDSDGNPSVIKNCLAAAASYKGCSANNNVIICLAGRNMTLENNYIAEYSLLDGVKVTGSTADSSNGAAALTSDIRSKAWYESTLGFDFTNDWKFLEGSEGYMLPVLKWMNAPLTTTIFNMPSEDGVNLVYIEGNEFYDYTQLKGSWGQDISVTQLSGEKYAAIVTEDASEGIYAGDENGDYQGAGTATFKVGFAPAVSGLFNISGRDTFDVNVSYKGEEKTITTAEDFVNIRKNPSGNFVLAADIDLAGVEFNGFCNGADDNPFTGSIDGQGHSVKNIRLTFTSGANKGLFGKTSGATIKNIAFVNYYIDGGLSGVKQIGLIGGGSAVIENCAFVGKVVGNDHVALVAGDSDGIEMKNCYAVGTVEGGSQVGGFFGCTLEGGATLENCLSNVNASASFRGWTGGFIGLLDKANSTVTIKNCVSIGDCKTTGTDSPKHASPFIGGNGAGDTANAIIYFSGNIYNNTAVMDAQDGADWPGKNVTAEGGDVQEATPYNPNALTSQATYTGIDWDFDNVWAMGQGDYKYPVLKGVAVSDATLGIEDVVATAESSLRVAGGNGEILVAGISEASVITVYNAAGVQVATVATDAPEAVVAAPAAGLYIVAVATDGAVSTAKVVVK